MICCNAIRQEGPVAMKINVLSDLHLGVSPMDTPMNDADVVVLAGDIAAPRQAAAWAMRFGKPVIYVLGNHEFYGGRIPDAAHGLKRLCAGTAVHVLDDEALVLDGVRFLGTTLWTDFMLFGSSDRTAVAIDEAQRKLRDFSRIRIGAGFFTPANSAALFACHAAWLERKLQEPHGGPTVVVTHHAPSPRSIHSRFAGSTLNASFVSDAERLLGGDRAALWIHGHTHDSFDYVLNGTRVLCNPRGYARDGAAENAVFDPDLIVDIG
jgi:predicted phosphodiesterase